MRHNSIPATILYLLVLILTGPVASAQQPELSILLTPDTINGKDSTENLDHILTASITNKTGRPYNFVYLSQENNLPGSNIYAVVLTDAAGNQWTLDKDQTPDNFVIGRIGRHACINLSPDAEKRVLRWPIAGRHWVYAVDHFYEKIYSVLPEGEYKLQLKLDYTRIHNYSTFFVDSLYNGMLVSNEISVHVRSSGPEGISKVTPVLKRAAFPGTSYSFFRYLCCEINRQAITKGEVRKYKKLNQSTQYEFRLVVDTAGRISLDPLQLPSIPGGPFKEALINALNNCPRWEAALRNGRKTEDRFTLLLEIDPDRRQNKSTQGSCNCFPGPPKGKQKREEGL